MRTSKPHKTMKSILKVKTQSFIDAYKKNLFQGILEKPELDVVNESDNKLNNGSKIKLLLMIY